MFPPLCSLVLVPGSTFPKLFLMIIPYSSESGQFKMNGISTTAQDLSGGTTASQLCSMMFLFRFRGSYAYTLRQHHCVFRFAASTSFIFFFIFELARNVNISVTLDLFVCLLVGWIVSSPYVRLSVCLCSSISYTVYDPKFCPVSCYRCCSELTSFDPRLLYLQLELTSCPFISLLHTLHFFSVSVSTWTSLKVGGVANFPSRFESVLQPEKKCCALTRRHVSGSFTSLCGRVGVG